MRAILFGVIALVGACTTSGGSPPLSAIEVVYHPEVMYYTIEDRGPARMAPGASERIYEFEASHEDFRRIADLLEPLEAEGLTCTSPPEHGSPGYIIFRRGDVEKRVVMPTSCYSDGSRPLAVNADRAYRAMEEMGRARYVAPVIPDPAIITVERRYWGNLTSSWSVSRAGEGRYIEREQVSTFAVQPDVFDRLRDIFRSYESRHFECNRVIADGPSWRRHLVLARRAGRSAHAL